MKKFHSVSRAICHFRFADPFPMNVSPKGFRKDWELQNVFWITVCFSNHILKIGIIWVERKAPFLQMVKPNKPFLFWLNLFKLTVHFVTTQKPNSYWYQQKQSQVSQVSDRYFLTCISELTKLGIKPLIMVNPTFSSQYKFLPLQFWCSGSKPQLVFLKSVHAESL